MDNNSPSQEKQRKHRPILSYSGRGIGAGAGRGRGGRDQSGRGRGHGRGRGRGRQGSNAWVRGVQASVPNAGGARSTSPTAPIGNKWVRPKDEDQKCSSASSVDHLGTVDASTATADSISTPPVLVRPNIEGGNDPSSKKTKKNKHFGNSSRVWKRTDDSMNNEPSDPDVARKRKEEETPHSTNTAAVSGKGLGRQSNKRPRNEEKFDTHASAAGGYTSRGCGITSSNIMQGRLGAKGGRGGRGRGRNTTEVKAKRIRLDKKPNGKNDDEDNQTDSSKYTDFAYRETRSNRGGRRGGRGTSNMGLVRIRTEDSNASRICPAFARGADCDNARCLLRHDIPSEYSTPICVFFQRHGQCHKGDACPFRHVKVDPRASICSSFNILGYCEDTNCPYKHVKEK